ncbi:50S ribosomal protein L25/general stress protein Ctc [Actinospica sp. MGRD01-02]|uniref:Large ribosomal subunit protein bL25 n=1 Tax=Actinospica acidithermotolerans TaxID=2828514 RepID=A0A941IJT0_9ACTN|nr:50S ribosomal protein L25/general stress protein Ctc [Actinospica acidithermotolerans]MBR7827413.1 50S ribosomal protein L25/general stress protein Ctc [Actinospica acidithermotolerans]
MSEIKIAAEPRDTFGKGAARQLRRDGKIPAVLYGHKQEPVHLALPEHDLFLALKTPNVLLNLDIVGGKSELAIPKAVSKDPVKRTLEHVDLLLVRRGEKVTVDVPVVTAGEIAPGGLLELVLTSLSVEAEATHIPASFEVSIEGLEEGSQITAGAVPLPSGVTLVTDAEAVVVHVLTPAATLVEEESAEGEAEAGAEAEAE